MTTPAPDKRRARVRALFDRLPTRWLLTAIAGLVVLGTAAFGGLADAPPPVLPRVQAGDTHHGAQLDITPERAILVDSLPDQGFDPEPGHILLVITADVTNTWNTPATTLNNVGAADNLRALDLEQPLGVVLLADGTTSPMLQPRVPAQLGWVWEVADDGDLADGALLRVDIYDKVYRADGFVTQGERFESPFIAAYAELEIEFQRLGGGE